MWRSAPEPDPPPKGPTFISEYYFSDYYSLTPELPYGMTDDRPSGLRVLAKSLHLLALGWMASVVWLWLAEIQQSVQRQGAAPEAYASTTLIQGALPALLIEMMALGMTSLIAASPLPRDSRREWLHALWWTLLPNLFVLGTAYLMVG
jgi:hypothetical protein